MDQTDISETIFKKRATATIIYKTDAVGDSENDASTFAVAGESYAVANADATARDAADAVLDEGYMDGTAGVLTELRERGE